jgi:small GTP-binding protein
MAGRFFGKNNKNQIIKSQHENKIPEGFNFLFTRRKKLNDRSSQFAWSPSDMNFVYIEDFGSLSFLSVENGKLLKTLNVSPIPYSISWSPNGQEIAVGLENGRVNIYEAISGELKTELSGHSRAIQHLAWSPFGRSLAGVFENYVFIWDTKSKKTKFVLEGHSDDVTCVEWSKNGRILATSSIDNTVRTWDAQSGQTMKVLKGHSNAVLDLTWLRYGSMLASSSLDATLSIWDGVKGEKLRTLEGHTEGIDGISCSSNGKMLASKSKDNSIRIWRCDSWDCVATLSIKNEQYISLGGIKFHPLLPILAYTDDENRIIRIWELDYDVILANAPKKQSVFYTTAKIALVGDSGVGKSGLGWRIASKEFQQTESTHGQQFWVIDEFGEVRSDGTECEAVLWDFAGQPDYRLIHALFLDDVNLALVLFDPTNRQEPLKGVEFWLKQLRGSKADCRIVLVAARADRGSSTLTEAEIMEFCEYHDIHGYISTSALSGKGVTELVEMVKSGIDWESMTATVTTATFKRIKEYVLKLKEDPSRRGVLVSPAELRARLEATDDEWTFSDAEMMTAVGHLENHGYITILTGSNGAEHILLAPDVLTNLAASFVLEARRNPRGLGALEEEKLLRREYDFPELNGLDEGEQEILLDAAVALFLKYNICLREPSDTQTLLIFPSLINQKRPLIEDIPTRDDVSYTVSGAVENVYAVLVVRLGYTNVFRRTHQWQNQAQYEMGKKEICGFRLTDEREGEIELVLYYGTETPDYARSLFSGLFEKFLRERDVEVTKYPPVVCQNGHLQQRAAVQANMRDGLPHLFCNQCGDKIMLSSAAAGVALTDPEQAVVNAESARAQVRTFYETALVRVKGFIRDRGDTAAPTCFISYAWGKTDQEQWVLRLATDLRNAGLDVALDRWDNR